MTPLILPYEGTAPALAGDPAFCGSDATLIGRLTMGAGARLGTGSVIRADGHFVRIGADFALGEGATVHIAHERYPTIIGDGVTAGRNAVVHACTVGDGCVIEDDVVILDASEIGENVLIEASSTVYPRSKLEAGQVYGGSPVKPLRAATPEELARRRAALREAIAASGAAAGRGKTSVEAEQALFVADTAGLAGKVVLGPRVSVFFGCVLDAGAGRISVGERTNIQDNTRILALERAEIGRDVTFGHNVLAHDCTVHDGSLIGIGARLAPGTVVESEVLVAAGAETREGQVLERGWLWGGRPARPITKLDEPKRAMMADTIVQYGGYAAAYRALQPDKAR